MFWSDVLEESLSRCYHYDRLVAAVCDCACMHACMHALGCVKHACVRVIASRNYLARGTDLRRCAKPIARSLLSARERPPRAASEMPREIEWLAIHCLWVMNLAPFLQLPLRRRLSRCASQI